MGSGRILVAVVCVTGCRFGFADLDGGTADDDDDGGGLTDVATTDDGGTPIVTCARTQPTTPTYWCDTNTGLDSNPGTQNAKVKTVARALQLASANGGTIIVGPGNYPEAPDISTTKPLLLLSEQRYAARLQRVNCAGCTDLTIEGFEISGSSLSLVQVTGGARVTIRDNAIYNGNSAGVRITSAATAITIESNVIWDAFAAPIHLNDASAAIRNNVIFFDNGSTTGIGKIWLEAANNTVVSGNVIFRGAGNDGGYGMISLRATTGTTIVENNLVAGSPAATNVYASIGFDMATGSAIIRHNTFVGPFPGTAFGLGAGNLFAGANFTLVNNLWASAGTTQPFTDGNAGTKITIRHNLYWNGSSGTFTAGGSPVPTSDAERIVADPGLPTTALPAGPLRSGAGFVGGATTTCEAHDQLVEAIAKIAATSPAVGVADPTQSPTTDIRGHARPAIASVGAYEP